MKLPEIFAGNRRGSTLVEVLLVIAISTILVGAALPVYSGLQQSAQLNESTTQLVQTVRIAQQRARARFNGTGHGVAFFQTATNDYYVLYQGESYAARDASVDRIVTLDAGLILATTISGADLYFPAGRMQPDMSGAVSLTHAVGGSRVVQITADGQVYEEAP